MKTRPVVDHLPPDIEADAVVRAAALVGVDLPTERAQAIAAALTAYADTEAARAGAAAQNEIAGELGALVAMLQGMERALDERRSTIAEAALGRAEARMFLADRRAGRDPLMLSALRQSLARVRHAAGAELRAIKERGPTKKKADSNRALVFARLAGELIGAEVKPFSGKGVAAIRELLKLAGDHENQLSDEAIKHALKGNGKIAP